MPINTPIIRTTKQDSPWYANHSTKLDQVNLILHNRCEFKSGIPWKILQNTISYTKIVQNLTPPTHQ